MSESSVRRRYRDFDWLRSELDRESKVSFPLTLLFIISLCLHFRLLFPNFLVRHGKDKFPSALMTDFLTATSLRLGEKDWKSSLISKFFPNSAFYYTVVVADLGSGTVHMKHEFANIWLDLFCLEE